MKRKFQIIDEDDSSQKSNEDENTEVKQCNLCEYNENLVNCKKCKIVICLDCINSSCEFCGGYFCKDCKSNVSTCTLGCSLSSCSDCDRISTHYCNTCLSKSLVECKECENFQCIFCYKFKNNLLFSTNTKMLKKLNKYEKEE